MLLLDEPLGALDLKLREEMQVELKQIQRDVGITFVFVTHDQGEALTMSKRIAVFDQGRIEQVGTPTEIYEQPASEFVAGFVGTSNVLAGAAARRCSASTAPYTVRPEKIRLLAADAAAGAATSSPPARCATSSTSAAGRRYRVVLDAGPELVVDAQNLETTAAADTRARTARSGASRSAASTRSGSGTAG